MADPSPSGSVEVVAPARIVVLISGNGSNLQALLDAQAAGQLNVVITGVVSNRRRAYGLQRAEKAGVVTHVLPFRRKKGSTNGDTETPEAVAAQRIDYDSRLAALVDSLGVDLVVLAGWDRLLTSAFVSQHTTVNLHPAQPGAYPGLGAIERVYDDWVAGNADAGGVMVHYVPDEGVDDGPVIDWTRVDFHPNDTLETFTERVHRAEHTLLVNCVQKAVASLSTSGA